MQKLPFLYCILAIINPEVEGKDFQTIMCYDCSSLRDLNIWDAFTRCKDRAERKMEEQEVTIVQRIMEQWLTGFTCSVEISGGDVNSIMKCWQE